MLIELFDHHTDLGLAEPGMPRVVDEHQVVGLSGRTLVDDVIHTWTGFAAMPAGRATFVILEGGSP